MSQNMPSPILPLWKTWCSNVAQKLSGHEHVEWFRVEVESMESIHNHNAFARIERRLKETRQNSA